MIKTILDIIAILAQDLALFSVSTIILLNWLVVSSNSLRLKAIFSWRVLFKSSSLEQDSLSSFIIFWSPSLSAIKPLISLLRELISPFRLEICFTWFFSI